MANTTEEQVMRTLRERAARGDLSGVEITYRVSGGSPADRVQDEIHLSGIGQVKARVRTSALSMRESSEEMPAPQVKALLAQIGDGMDGLIPRSDAHFIPDSIVGQVSVRIGGQEASFFFLPDPAQAEQHGQLLSPGAVAAVEGLARLHKRILQS